MSKPKQLSIYIDKDGRKWYAEIRSNSRVILSIATPIGIKQRIITKKELLENQQLQKENENAKKD